VELRTGRVLVWGGYQDVSMKNRFSQLVPNFPKNFGMGKKDERQGVGACKLGGGRLHLTYQAKGWGHESL